MEIQKGTLLRNKSDKSYAIVICEPYTKFFRDVEYIYGEFESGVADTAIRIKWVANGYEHVCAIDELGSINCWGRDNYDQVSNAPQGTFTSINSGLWHSCALKDGAILECWGKNDVDQSFPIP